MLRPSTTAPTPPRAPIEDQSGRVKQLEAEVSALSEKLRQQAMESLKRINVRYLREPVSPIAGKGDRVRQVPIGE